MVAYLAPPLPIRISAASIPSLRLSESSDGTRVNLPYNGRAGPKEAVNISKAKNMEDWGPRTASIRPIQGRAILSSLLASRRTQRAAQAPFFVESSTPAEALRLCTSPLRASGGIWQSVRPHKRCALVLASVKPSRERSRRDQ